MASRTLSTDEMEAILKMAGVLIKTDWVIGWVAMRGSYIIEISTKSKEACIKKTFSQLQGETK